jgi:hypothetical protein
MSPQDAAPAVAPERDDSHTRPAAQQELRELGRATLARATEQPPPRESGETVRSEDTEPTVDLARVAWVVTVLACLLAVTILVLDGYVGYAGVTLAVAVAAGINLL